jgi:hypothetical protein
MASHKYLQISPLRKMMRGAKFLRVERILVEAMKLPRCALVLPGPVNDRRLGKDWPRWMGNGQWIVTERGGGFGAETIILRRTGDMEHRICADLPAAHDPHNVSMLGVEIAFHRFSINADRES